MRVFLDTNVLVAAFVTRGLCRDLLAEVVLRHELLLGAVVVAEAKRILPGKLGLAEGFVSRRLAVLADYYVDCPAIAWIEVEVRDPNDVEIVRCAIANRADVLVSGDRDLLDATLPIRVLSPREIWQALRPGLQPETIHEPAEPFG